MKIISGCVLGMSLVAAAFGDDSSLTAKSVSSAQVPAASASVSARKVGPQTGPIVGGMLEDGRDVPARFRGLESKEQKVRREQQEQNQKESEEE